LWRHPEFLKLWTAETISQLGTQVTLLGLPLIAILLLKANAFEVGLLGTVEFLPFILFGLPAGAWVDRLRRRPILIIGDLGRVLSLGSIPFVYELGHLTLLQLYVVAFVTGVLTVFFDVSYHPTCHRWWTATSWWKATPSSREAGPQRSWRALVWPAASSSGSGRRWPSSPTPSATWDRLASSS